jgi:hypothetical protein
MVGWLNVSDDIKDAIRRASERYPFINDQPLCTAQYLAAISYRESTWTPSAVAKGGTATGLYQFLEKTWNGLRASVKVDSHWRDCGRTGSPPAAGTQAWLDLRKDPLFSSFMVTTFTLNSLTIIKQYADLKRYGGGDLYMAHVLGAGGAKCVLAAINGGDGNITIPEAYEKYSTKLTAADALRSINGNPFGGTLTPDTTCSNARLVFTYALYSNTTDTIPATFKRTNPGDKSTSQAPTIETYKNLMTPCHVASAHSDPTKSSEKLLDPCGIPSPTGRGQPNEAATSAPRGASVPNTTVNVGAPPKRGGPTAKVIK